MPGIPRDASSFYPGVALHALAWLCAANAVGVLLALMLLVPSLNTVLAPFTYGRLIPVHLNGTLYGWCMIPLLGLLFSWYFGPGARARSAIIALNLWSISLGVGCLYWMFGVSSGKLFMEWRGGSRWLLSANMLVLAAVLLGRLIAKPDPVRRRAFLKWAGWCVLLPVPVVMFLAADPAVYPPVNPDSGGATGGNLLVSSLGLVTIMWITPFLLDLEHRVTARRVYSYVIIQALHYVLFAAIGHGDRSHHEVAQIVALASLVAWIPLLVMHFRRFNWPESARPWLWSFAVWGAFLVVTANIMFAPGLLEQWKFTNFLVGHTHAAMAGMLSSFNLLVLVSLNRENRIGHALGQRSLFWSWNTGTLLHVVALKLLGILEGRHPEWLYMRGNVTDAAYAVRLFAGLLMFGVSMLWLLQVLESSEESSHEKS